VSLRQIGQSRSCTDPQRRLYSNTGHSKYDNEHVWLLNSPRWTRCRDCPVQASTFASRVRKRCGAMRAGCVISMACMQLPNARLQNSNARFRPCSVKLNIELYHGCILCKTSSPPYKVEATSARSVISHVVQFPVACQQCLRRIGIHVPFGCIPELIYASHCTNHQPACGLEPARSDHVVFNMLAEKRACLYRSAGWS